MKLVKHVGIALVAATVLWSCNEEHPESGKIVPGKKAPEREQVRPELIQTPGTQQAPAAGEPDQYGRMPGDAHYGHDHPILEDEQNNQNQTGSPMQQGSPVQQPADGEPDAYGRMPGDAHYGHDHP